MKYADLVKKNVEELKKLISDYRAELFSLRFKNATRQLDKTHRIDEIKKDIARALTALNQKQISTINTVISSEKNKNTNLKPEEKPAKTSKTSKTLDVKEQKEVKETKTSKKPEELKLKEVTKKVEVKPKKEVASKENKSTTKPTEKKSSAKTSTKTTKKEVK